jgi:hypothetical protein
MKRLLALVVLLLLGFYVAWPAWSGYRIAAALQSKDATMLASKIDFASVRTGLRPVVEVEVGKEIDKQAGQGLGGVLGGDLKKQLAPKLVDMVLNTVITPENIIRIASEGGNVAGSVQKIMMEQLSKSGGIPGMPNIPGLGGGSGGGGGLPGGLGSVLGAAGAAGLKLPGGLNIPGMGGGQAQAPAPVAAPAAPAAKSDAKPSYGMSNIKSFGFSPLAYTVGVGRDPAAAKSDATIKMSFSGFDWKITDIVPNLN